MSVDIGASSELAARVNKALLLEPQCSAWKVHHGLYQGMTSKAALSEAEGAAAVLKVEAPGFSPANRTSMVLGFSRGKYIWP